MPNDKVAKELAVMSNELQHIKGDISDIKKELRDLKESLPKRFVSQDKFGWFEKVFWLGMGLLITTVGGRLLDLL